jgi:hypothetical protein
MSALNGEIPVGDEQETVGNEQQAARHTPGPWTVPISRIGPNQVFRVMAGCHQIADTIEDNGKVDAWANAALIASAPDLLTALRELSEWMRSHTGPRDGTYDMLCRACAALAKAEGLA